VGRVRADCLGIGTAKGKSMMWVTCKRLHLQENPLTPNDPYSGRTVRLTSKRCILYIYSTNIGTEYFKLGIYYRLLFSSKCSSFHNSNVLGSCIIHFLYTGGTKLKKKNNSGAKTLKCKSLKIKHCA